MKIEICPYAKSRKHAKIQNSTCSENCAHQTSFANRSTKCIKDRTSARSVKYTKYRPPSFDCHFFYSHLKSRDYITLMVKNTYKNTRYILTLKCCILADKIKYIFWLECHAYSINYPKTILLITALKI